MKTRFEPMAAADFTPRSVRRPGPRFIALVLVLLIAAAGGMYAWEKANHAYHFAVVRDGVLYRDGSRSVGQFSAALDRAHAKTVVSLVDAYESSDPSKPQFVQEEKLCAQKGVRLEKIEVKLGGWPTSEDIQRFLRIVSDEQNQPVLVHCAQGVRRTAMFVAAYQESVLGYDKQQAEDAILTFGHSDHTINDIRRFIDHYDAKAEVIEGDLGPGKE